MTIAHGSLQSPTGVRKLITPANTNQVFDLCQWQTRERENQELELMCYPEYFGEGGAAPVAAGYVNAALEITIAQGGDGGGAAFSTTFASYLGNRLLGMLVPNNGVRVRFCAREVKVRIQPGAAANYVIFASLTPVAGPGPCEVIPQLVSLNPDTSLGPGAILDPAVVPKGARFVRGLCADDPMGSIRFYDAKASPATVQTIPIAACTYESVPIDQRAFFVAYLPSNPFAPANFPQALFTIGA